MDGLPTGVVRGVEGFTGCHRWLGRQPSHRIARQVKAGRISSRTRSLNEARLTMAVASRDWIPMTAIGLSVVLVVAIVVTALVVLSITVLFKTGSLRDLTYVAEVVRAFRRKKKLKKAK